MLAHLPQCSQRPNVERTTPMGDATGPLARDLLSELLRSVGFSSTVLCRSELTAPWGFEVKARGFGAFHIVLQGTCCLEVDGVAEQVWLGGGDLVILPRGSAHIVRDAPSSPTVALDRLALGADENGFLRAGGDGPRTELLCGGLRFDDRAINPMLTALPRVVRLSALSGSLGGWVRSIFGFLASESTGPRAGREMIVSRIIDVLFVEAIRTFFESSDASQSSFAAALRDPGLCEALASIHNAPQEDWDVETLARQAGMSRTAFATQFAALVGAPPLRYLSRYRMHKAAQLLRSSRATIAEIAESVGYDSDAGFSRAFKRVVGAAPAAYRSAR